MTFKLATKTDVVSCAGCVRVELRIGDEFAVTVLSPKAARMMASHLSASADDAEAWGGEGIHGHGAWAPPAPQEKKKRRKATQVKREG